MKLLLSFLLLLIAMPSSQAAVGIVQPGFNDPTIYGCVRKWTFNGTFEDFSGSAVTVTNAGTTFTNAMGGQGLLFNGTGAYVGAAGYNFGTNDVTISLWVCPSNFVSAPDLFDTLWLTNSGTRPNSMAIVLDATTGAPKMFNNGSFRLTSSIATTSNVFNHVVLTRSNSVFRFWVNGVVSTTSTNLTYSDSGLAMIVGRYSDSAAGYLIGVEDNVRIHNRALTGDEIKKIYNGTQH